MFGKNLSLRLSLTLVRNEEVKHYIKIKIHKPIILRFLVESAINADLYLISIVSLQMIPF